MTPQERDLISHLFARLQQAGNQPKDREADALIAQGLQQVPDAPYLLVQTVLIQDMALAEAQRRIADLERQAAAPRPAEPAPSFLGGARGSVPAAGPWGAAPAAPHPQQQPGGPVWTQSGAAAAPATMAPLASPGASSGFLRQAATTAAGIAGGALLFQGISSLFGPHYGGGMFSGMAPQPGLGETVINNYYDNPAPDAQTATADWSGNDPGAIPADDSQPIWDNNNQDYGGGDDSGQDFGGNDDYGSDPGGGIDI